MNTLINQRQNIYLQLQEKQEKIHELESQLIATQKLAAMGTMTFVIAHEFNGLLAPIINHCELIQKYPDDKDLATKSLQKILKNSLQAAKVIQNILGLACPDSQTKEPTNLWQLINDSLECIVREFRKDNINVKMGIPENASINVVRCEFQQVLLNLIINARQAMLIGGGTLSIKLIKDNDNQIDILEISDTGSGIKEEHLDKIFEPFFTTKANSDDPDSLGTGLGLMICKNIIEKHNGNIAVQSEFGQGTTFAITIPQ